METDYRNDSWPQLFAAKVCDEMELLVDRDSIVARNASSSEEAVEESGKSVEAKVR